MINSSVSVSKHNGFDLIFYYLQNYISYKSSILGRLELILEWVKLLAIDGANGSL